MEKSLKPGTMIASYTARGSDGTLELTNRKVAFWRCLECREECHTWYLVDKYRTYTFIRHISCLIKILNNREYMQFHRPLRKKFRALRGAFNELKKSNEEIFALEVL